MKSQECSQEPQILPAAAAAGRDSLSQELRQHVESCPACRGALDLQDRLRQLARETRPHRLPEAGELWWRAEIIRRWVEREDAVREAERPLLWSRVIAFILILLTPVSLVAAAPPLVAVLVAGALAPLTVFLGWLLLQRDA